MASIIPKLIEVAAAEWKFFDNQELRLDGTFKKGRQEFEDGAWQRVGDYWKQLGGAFANLTGKDRGTPWSAAFISFCMREAGAGVRFPYSSGHATYINKAISNAAASKIGEPIFGHRLADYVPKVGDLIG